ncbi:F-box only protein 43 [Aulostomus maculatus]
MQCTPETNAYHNGCKGKHCYDCSDSGYSGLFHSPQSLSGEDSSRSLSSVDISGTPKENLRPSVTPGSRESVRCMGQDSTRVQRPLALNWCETPRVYKRNVSLRHRLLLSKPTTDIKRDCTRSPCIRGTDSSISATSEQWLSVSFGSLDNLPPTLTLSTLNFEQDLPLSGGKRRLLFSQVRTSTLEDGNRLSSIERKVSFSNPDFIENISASDQLPVQMPCLSKFMPVSSKENSQSPVSSVTDVYDSSSVLCTPSSTHTPKCIRSQCEDSGFSSLTLDKSQDSLVDHDGSFQEFLLSAFRGTSETPNLGDAKRRSRLQRQHRLSTLKEGGSQSEEDLTDRQRECYQLHHSYKDDEVFVDGTTPCKARSVKRGDIMNSDGLAPVKHYCATPLRVTGTEPDNLPPLDTSPNNSDATPHNITAENLSLTPALQLVHALCQQRAQMFVGQSPSLKEQLKFTTALAETPMTLRTTMPLAGLIGRKMGLGKVDILTELKKRNLRHILAFILSHLSTEAIYRCGQVCKSWNEIIQKDKQASIRRGIHLVELEASLELDPAVQVADAETRLTLLKRSALKTVQPQSRTSSYCTPQSGNRTVTPSQYSTLHSGSSSKREKFLEVAKTLFSDECLKPCPHCQHPARCHSVKGEGVCSRADCGFRFCTACLCASHGSRECVSQSLGCRRKDILLPGSAQSKRNIRRL